MSNTESDNSLILQLMEATQALYRAAVALEGVGSDLHSEQGMRCPFFVPDTSPASVGSTTERLRHEGVIEDETAHLDPANFSSGPTGTTSLDPLIDTIDERAGFKAHLAFPNGPADQVPERDAIDRADGDSNKAIVRQIHGAVMALRDALPRVSDPVAVQRIGGAIGLLDETIGQICKLENGLGVRNQSTARAAGSA